MYRVLKYIKYLYKKDLSNSLFIRKYTWKWGLSVQGKVSTTYRHGGGSDMSSV